MQELTSDRNWASIFEAPAFNTAWSNAPFTPKEGESFWDLSQLEGGKPKVAGQACCSYKVEQQEYARTYAQILEVVLILVDLVGLAHCKSCGLMVRGVVGLSGVSQSLLFARSYLRVW